MMPNVEQELIKAAKIAKREPGEDQQTYLTRVLRSALSSINDKAYSKLSEEAQAWIETAASEHNAKNDLSEIPGMEESGDEPPADDDTENAEPEDTGEAEDEAEDGGGDNAGDEVEDEAAGGEASDTEQEHEDVATRSTTTRARPAGKTPARNAPPKRNAAPPKGKTPPKAAPPKATAAPKRPAAAPPKKPAPKATTAPKRPAATPAKPAPKATTAPKKPAPKANTNKRSETASTRRPMDAYPNGINGVTRTKMIFAKHLADKGEEVATDVIAKQMSKLGYDTTVSTISTTRTDFRNSLMVLQQLGLLKGIRCLIWPKQRS